MRRFRHINNYLPSLCLILLDIFLSFSCKRDVTPKLTFVSDISINIDSLSKKDRIYFTGLNITSSDTLSSILLYANLKTRLLHLINLERKQDSVVIQLKELFEIYEVSKHDYFTYISLDSIAYFNNSSNEIAIFNSIGKIYKKIHIPSKDSTKNWLFDPTAFWGLPFLYTHGSFLVAIPFSDIGVDSTSINEYFKRPPDFFLQNHGSSQYFGIFDRLYTKNFYNDVHPYRLIGNNGQVVYAPKHSHSIYAFEKDNTYKEYIVKSKYILNQLPTINFYEMRKRSALNSFNLRTPRYEGMVYNSTTKHYYRIVKHEFQPKKNETSGQVQSEINAPYSVIILDQDFEIKSEILMPTGNHFYSWVYPYKSGIIISKLCDSCQDKNLMVFSYFSE